MPYHLCTNRAMDVGILCFLFVPCYLLISTEVVCTDKTATIWEDLWNLNTMISGKGSGILFGLGLGRWYKFTPKVY